MAVIVFVSVYVFVHGCAHSYVPLRRRCMQPKARFELRGPQTVPGPAPTVTSLHQDTKKHNEQQYKAKEYRNRNSTMKLIELTFFSRQFCE